MQVTKESSNRPGQDVFRIAKSAQPSSVAADDTKTHHSEPTQSNVYLPRRRPDRFTLTSPMRRFRQCNICSTTYRAGGQRNKWWQIKRTPEAKDACFVRYDDRIEYGYSCGSRMESMLAGLIMLLLFLILFLTVFWVLHYREGLGNQKSLNMWFNWHPVAMVAGFVTISGASMLLPKFCIFIKPIHVTFIHALLHIGVIPCAVFGMVTVLDHHNLSKPSLPNFNSMHSWLGLITLGTYGFQMVIGIFSFLVYHTLDGDCCQVPSSIEGLHKLVGAICFGLTIFTCLSGLSERTFSVKYGGSEEQTFVNCLGIISLLAGVAVILFLKFVKS